MDSCRLDISAPTARNLVDAARALPEQADLVNLAANNHLSFERLVATSRLATEGADDDTITGSLGYDLGGVDRLRHRRRRISRSSERDVFVDRHLYLQDSIDGARGRSTGELPGFDYRIFTKAIEERSEMFGDLPGPRVGKAQRMVDALVSISQDSLELPAANGEAAGRSEPLVSVLVEGALAADADGESGAEIEFGTRVGPATLERILCEGRVQVFGLASGKPVTTSDGTRSIPPAIRRFVAWRDGSCTVDGCHSPYRLQPHHVRHRANGGNHDPDNLATLCWFHHHVVAHGMGLELDPGSPPQRRRFFRRTASGADPP